MPTREHVRLVLDRVHRGSDLAFFFDKLTSPDWIPPLQDEGLFQNPPRPEVDGDLVRYPDWPAARYLVRVAGAAPETVLQTIQAVPVSDNPRIYDAFVQAALEMPAPTAAHLASDVVIWLRTVKHLLLLPIHAAKLVAHLARGGATPEAMLVAQELLATDAPIDSDKLGSPRQLARVGQYELATAIDEMREPLVSASGTAALDLFINALGRVLPSRSNKRESLPLEDYSSVWRPILTEHAHLSAEIDDLMVDAVIQAAEQLVQEGGGSGREAFARLATGEWKILRRIALHLVGRFPDQVDVALASRLVVSAKTVRDSAYEYELQVAIANVFSRLSPGRRAKYVNLVRHGPRITSATRRAVGDEWDAYVAHWQAKRLAPIFNQLDATDRDWASGVVEEGDVPDLLAKPHPAVASFVGPTSPRTSDELGAMPMYDLLEFLRNWEPSGEWASPSREGLGRALSAAVTDKPRRYASGAQDFVGYQPVYVRALISGLRDAVLKGSRISWRPVLALSDWVVRQSLDETNVDWRASDDDPGWGWTWTDLARLFSAGMSQSGSGLPRSAASDIWSLLERLATNPEPTAEFEERYGGANMDPTNLALNTGRGQAMHAVVRYAWWVTKGRGPIRSAVRKLLEAHADPMREQSLAVHSVYGQWLAVLLALDPQWVQGTLLPLIFPTDRELHSYWEAAWDSYVLYGKPSRSVFESAKGEYLRAIETLEDRSSNDRHADDRIRGFVAHIVLYYLWGLYDLDDEEGLLRRFNTVAPSSARGELISYAGRLLRNESGDQKARLPAEQVDQLKQLWLARRLVIEHAPGESTDEPAAFAWWCGAEQLEPEWWLPQLQWVTDLGVEPEPLFAVLQALPAAATVDPRVTLRIIRRLLDVAREPWAFVGHVDDLRSAILTAIASGDRVASEIARQLVDAIGAREIADLSDLI